MDTFAKIIECQGVSRRVLPQGAREEKLLADLGILTQLNYFQRAILPTLALEVFLAGLLNHDSIW